MPRLSPFHALLVLATVALVGTCGGPAPTPEPSPAAGRTVKGPFALELVLDRSAYAAGDTISGSAQLWYAGPGPLNVSASGSGLIMFAITEVDGERSVGGAAHADCASYTLNPAAPVTQPLTKSGGFSPDDPNHDFAEAFLTDPLFRLPPGTWEITAVASFLGDGCALPETNLQASARITVSD